MGIPNYTVTVETALRTLTVNEKFSHSFASGNLPTAATPVAQQIVDVIEDQGLTLKSIQGTIAFGALSGRVLGGQATYSTLPPGFDAATPAKATAVVNAVEPEHRISFAISPGEVEKTGTSSVLNLADALQRRVLEGLYEQKLYKHEAR